MSIYFYDHKYPNYELSNFYPHIPGKKLKSLNIVYDNEVWPTAEHLYQALKFRWETPDELKWKELIKQASTPTKAKYLGNQYTHTKWSWQKELKQTVLNYKNKVRLRGDLNDDKFRVNIMYKTVMAKFQSNIHLKNYLLSTGTNTLGEYCGCFWGKFGKNALGEILEKVREEIKMKN